MDENKINSENTAEEVELTASVPASDDDNASEKTALSQEQTDSAAPEIDISNEVVDTEVTPTKQEDEISPPAESPIPKDPTPKPELQAHTPTAYTYRWDYHTQFREDAERLAKEKKRGKGLYAGVFASVILVTVALLIGVMLLGNIFPEVNAGGDTLLADVYEECLPSYVAISVMTPTGEGAGSGIVLTSDGYISTNYHVVEDATEITIIMSDNTTYEATYLDGDEINDIAVLKVDAKGLTPAKLGSSEDSRVGDQVMAIGTPYSINYRGTMTSGHISALDRRFVENNENGTVSRVLSLIQTDTSVNPGNSGGPLFNMEGEVIGVVSLKISGDNYEGLGFAIPIESVMDIINDIIENGKITNPGGGSAYEGAALGITGFAVEKDTKYLLNGDYHYTVTKDETTGDELVIIPTILGNIPVPLKDTDQLAEYDIKDFTFIFTEAAGIYVFGTNEKFDSSKKLKVGDIIVSADGISCSKMTSLQSLIADKRIGDVIEMEIYRDGKLETVKVELGRASTTE